MKDMMDEYPTTITLTDKQLPCLKDCKVGTKMTVEMEVEVMSIGKSIYTDSKNLNGTLKVKSVKMEEMDEPMSEKEKQARKGHY